ncbi:DUF5008 domain-containing protein [Albibacterium profundi]|uniref:DUF5008 domain-containing protein n=1 Tax=Albibacterium profundi TaxID=3134906 RepID=A0ABV5CF48_9SPHI
MKFFHNKGVSVILLSILLSAIFTACQNKEIIGEDPYAGGKEALGVRFIGDYPTPESGLPGSSVTFSVEGLAAWEGKFDFFINDEPAEVMSVTDSTIQVIVPEEASSGGASISLEGQVFFGPRFNIEGNVSLDENYEVVNGTNSPVQDLIDFQSGYVLVGSFTNFENKAGAGTWINRIVSISSLGAYQENINSTKGANGTLLSINRLSDGKYIVSGAFNSYNDIGGINGITRLNADFSIDSIRKEMINLTPDEPLNGWDTVATFNGGVFGTVLKSFVSQTPDKGEQITVVGDFRQYGSYYYERATRDYQPMDIVTVPQVVRMDTHGKIDSTYNFDKAAGKFNLGGNGFVLDAVQTADNKIVLVGSFTTFHGESANYIVMLDEDGHVDPAFNVGSGANDVVSSIEYDPVSDTYLLVGAFSSFNGQQANRIVRINGDGAIDQSFEVSEFEGGEPNFAYQLKSGMIIVSGTFEKYNNITRRGFLILNNDGTVTQKYNNVGAFEGKIHKVVETSSTLGHPAVLLIGYIGKFNDQDAGNIIRVEIKNN